MISCDLCCSYGSHSNETLLMHYGFIIPSNCNDSVRLELLHQKLSHLFASAVEGDPKVRFLMDNGLTPSNIQKQHLVVLPDPGALPWNTVTVAKVLVVNDLDLFSCNNCFDSFLMEEVLSEDHERRWRMLLVGALCGSKK